MFALLLSLTLPTLAAPGPVVNGQTVDGATLVDQDYGFTLSLPAAEWQVLDQGQAGRLFNDAIAGGMSSKGGFLGAVVVEQTDVDLAAMDQLGLDGLGAVLTKVRSREPVTVSGEPAFRSVLDLNADGVLLRQDRLVVALDGHVYQVICNGPPEPDKQRCQDFLAGFSLNHTPVHGRGAAPIADVATRRWRVQDNVFQSAVNGFALRPPPGWRLVVGDELKQLHEQAEVGMIRTHPDAYAYLLPERAGEGSLEHLTAQYRSSFLENIAVGGDPQTVSVALGQGETEMLRVPTDTTVPMVFWHGVLGQDTRYWQTVAWTFAADADAVQADIDQLLAGFTLLSEPQRAELETALSKVPVDTDIGADWSIRGQVWTNYSAGFGWTAPAGLWELRAGAEAEAAIADAVFNADHLVSGANASLRWASAGGSLKEAHAAQIAYLDPPLNGIQKTKLLGHKALRSEHHSTNPLPMDWTITTFQDDHGRQWSWWTYALSSNAERARDDLAAATAALRGTNGLQARTLRPDRFESQRLGFRLALDGKLPCADIVPPNIEARADGISCIQGNRGVIAMAVRESSVGVGGEAVMQQMAEAMLGGELGPLAKGKQQTGPGTLGGLRSTRLSYGQHGEMVEVDMLSRDRVLVLFMLLGMSDAEREKWRAGFEFID